ncbi:MAG: aminomethyl-transferring glycine dehydrogenase subunit GcvPA [Candidatus Dormibacteria bacterium]
MTEHRYLPLSSADRATMLEVVGKPSQEALFDSIPAAFRTGVDLPDGLSEAELVDYFSELARENQDLTRFASFLGAGAYRRFIPAAVLQVIGRPEFFTAYTPYQAEASQGWLQTIFEFQSMIAELTGLPVANASMYEAATALAEAAVMAVAHTGRQKITLVGAVHPEYVAVMRSYAAGRFAVEVVPPTRGVADPKELEGTNLEETAAVVFQDPNFFGQLEDARALSDLAHAHGALAVVAADPIALAVIEAPGEYGADIAVGECQQLGIPLWYGGPYCGYLAASDALLRKIPGRLVGETTDAAGNRGFVLTLQAREQHIRRESATSNICTNQALIALGATAYMAVMGSEGLRRVAETSAQRAHHLAAQLSALPGYSLAFPGPFLYEFVLRCPEPAAAVLKRLEASGVIGGLDLGTLPVERPVGMEDCLLIAVTEMNSPAQLDKFIRALA